MQANLQCPNCTGYKVNDTPTKMLVDPHTDVLWKIPEKKVWLGQVWKDTSSPLTRLLYVCGILCGLVSIVLYLWLQSFQAWLILIIPSLLLLYISRLRLRAEHKRYRAVMRHSCSCQICGYRWAWRDDQPYPPIMYGPEASNLLARGSKQLEEEEKRQRDLQNAAGIYYWQQQQQRR